MPPECTFDDPPVELTDARLAPIISRRSIAPKRLRPPGPRAAEIQAMVEAALTAPDHGGLRCWRIIRVADDTREHLAEVFVAAKLRREPNASAAHLERERDKAMNAPVLLVVCARPQRGHAGIPEHEQLIAVGAAIQNLLLAAHGLGYGASLLSGEKARDPLVRTSLGLQADEILVGFLSIGSIAQPPPARPRPGTSMFITHWSGPAAPAAGIPSPADPACAHDEPVCAVAAADASPLAPGDHATGLTISGERSP